MSHENYVLFKSSDAYKQTIKSAKYWLEQAKIRRNGHTNSMPHAQAYAQCLKWSIDDLKWLLSIACKVS